MALSEHGVSRQEAHAKIKEVALNARVTQEKGEKVNLESMLADPYFEKASLKDDSNNSKIIKVRDGVIALANEPINFTGACVRQVQQFLKEEFRPSVVEYIKDAPEEKAQLDV